MSIKVYSAPERSSAPLRITLPISKSLSNRALILAGLCKYDCDVTNQSSSDDTAVLSKALANPNAEIIDIGAAGTAMRFLTAYLAVQEGRTVHLTGSERMRHRPIGVLVEALRKMGAQIDYVGDEGFPPLRITGQKLSGGALEVDGSISSQYISALLMIAPIVRGGLRLRLTGDVTSLPYIYMTLELMKKFGATKLAMDGQEITVAEQEYTGCRFQTEGDWSAASYWYEIAVLTRRDGIRLEGLCRESTQGDSHVADYFRELGVETEFCDGGVVLHPCGALPDRVAWNLKGQPDLAQTLIATCCGLDVPFDFTGLKTLRIKETDRLNAMRQELLKLGFVLRIEGDDRIMWDGTRCPAELNPEIQTYKDHRMAMCMAPLCLIRPEGALIIQEPEVVSKSYPDFWQDLRSGGLLSEDVSSH
jgi:3-phosphoshikimate 1-carboxyvinyltransferase